MSPVPVTANSAPQRDDRATCRSLALAAMETTIEVSGLRKRFGPQLALDGMTFTVLPGQVTGFVGPNGAGKSTTMRVILGLDAADEGTALVGGRPYASLRYPLSYVGSLLDAGALQPSRSARNHLLWLAHSQGLGASRVDEVIEQAGLRSASLPRCSAIRRCSCSMSRSTDSIPKASSGCGVSCGRWPPRAVRCWCPAT
jgi:ABC-type multidrug transport system ATPase subunit